MEYVYLLIAIVILAIVFKVVKSDTYEKFVDRNKDIIKKSEESISICRSPSWGRYYHIVCDCISEIAEKEGRLYLVPKRGQKLSEWETRADIPKEYLELKDYLKELFSKKYKALLVKKERQEEKMYMERLLKERETERERERILALSVDLYRSNKDANDRHITSSVKKAVWQRDQGKCTQCKSNEKLEYDHIIPVSKGGSNTERNVQLLCEKCNRTKHANIL